LHTDVSVAVTLRACLAFNHGIREIFNHGFRDIFPETYCIAEKSDAIFFQRDYFPGKNESVATSIAHEYCNFLCLERGDQQ
jgi:hypothetical protein